MNAEHEAVVEAFRRVAKGWSAGGDRRAERMVENLIPAVMRDLAALSPAPSAGVGVDDTMAAIMAEVERATRKFPTWPTDPLHAVAVVNEEVGELNKALVQAIYEPHKSTHEDVATEAIQAAAMTYRFVASLRRYTYDKCEQHEQPSLSQHPAACPHCDDTGDVHRVDGEWLGRCTCPQGQHPAAPSVSPAVAGGLIDREMIALALEYVAGDNAVTFSTAELREQASLIRRLASSAPQGDDGLEPLRRLLQEFVDKLPPAPAAAPLTVESAPVGTRAPAIMGGHWYKTQRGWKWNGPDGSGGVFPRPGGDWTGKLIAPAAEQPQGEMVLVPREPTQAMTNAYHEAQKAAVLASDKAWGISNPAQTFADGYRAMLTAAPSRPVVDEVPVPREVLYSALRELVRRIEVCGASPELTHASSLACDLMYSVGNKFNAPYPDALTRVNSALGQQGDGNGK